MHNGIMVFEDGVIVPFGTIITARRMITALQSVIQQLEQQERQQLLSSITDDELKQLVDTKAKK